MADKRIGTTFGLFNILDRIGVGGTAIVYLAVDAQNHYVALKILHANFAANAAIVRRFRKEAAIAATFEHPHILPVVHHGIFDDEPYIATLYMSGGSLYNRIKEDPVVRLAWVCELVTQIASALDYAHEIGIVHRDIKLENILLDENGHVYVADFGIARVLDSTQMTTTGAVFGTPLYMSPEQALGLRDIDRRSDVYSLAVLTYLLSTGYYPFTGTDSLVLLNRHLSMRPPAPRSVNPTLSPDIEAVLLKGLDKDRERRYESAGAFARDYSAAVAQHRNLRVDINLSDENPMLFATFDDGQEEYSHDSTRRLYVPNGGGVRHTPGVGADTFRLDEENPTTPIDLHTPESLKQILQSAPAQQRVQNPHQEGVRQSKRPAHGVLYLSMGGLIAALGATVFMLNSDRLLANQSPVGAASQQAGIIASDTATITESPTATSTPTDSPTLTITPLALVFAASAAGQPLALRSGDALAYPVVGFLAGGEASRIIAVSLRDENWVQVELINGQVAWVTADRLTMQGDLSLLPRIMVGTPTPTRTATFTATVTPTQPTNTPTDTRTSTATYTPTRMWGTRTHTPTNTPPLPPSNTPWIPPTNTPIPLTSTATNTPTRTVTRTSTPTSTVTRTASPTNTMTSTPTNTSSSTPTSSATASATWTNTPTQSATATFTAIETFILTSTPTEIVPTATETPEEMILTPTETPVDMQLATPTPTPQEMQLATPTPTPQEMQFETPTATATT